MDFSGDLLIFSRKIIMTICDKIVTLIRLRCGLLLEDVAYKFDASVSLISRIFRRSRAALSYPAALVQFY